MEPEDDKIELIHINGKHVFGSSTAHNLKANFVTFKNKYFKSYGYFGSYYVDDTMFKINKIEINNEEYYVIHPKTLYGLYLLAELRNCYFAVKNRDVLYLMQKNYMAMDLYREMRCRYDQWISTII